MLANYPFLLQIIVLLYVLLNLTTLNVLRPKQIGFDRFTDRSN